MRAIVGVMILTACDAGPRPEPAPVAPPTAPPAPHQVPYTKIVERPNITVFATPRSAPSASSGCTIDGTVIDSVTRQPLPRAVLGADSVVAEETDANGVFALQYDALPKRFVLYYGWYLTLEIPFSADLCGTYLRIEIDKARAIQKPT